MEGSADSPPPPSIPIMALNVLPGGVPGNLQLPGPHPMYLGVSSATGGTILYQQVTRAGMLLTSQGVGTPPRRNVDPSRRAMAPAYIFLPEDAASPIMIPEDEVGGVDFASVGVPHVEVAETCVILSDDSESKSPPKVELNDSD